LPGGLVQRPQPVVARRRVTRETVHLALEGLDLLTGLLVLDRPFADDVGQVDRLAAQVGPASGRARRREEQAGTQGDDRDQRRPSRGPTGQPGADPTGPRALPSGGGLVVMLPSRLLLGHASTPFAVRSPAPTSTLGHEPIIPKEHPVAKSADDAKDRTSEETATEQTPE